MPPPSEIPIQPQFLAPDSLRGTSIDSSVPGVTGTNSAEGTGVEGKSGKGDGMRATTASSSRNALFAKNESTEPCPPDMPGGNGVYGLSSVPTASGVFGENNHGGFGIAGSSATGVGVLGRGRVAGRFEGDVEVTGDIRLANADCAEDFDVSDEAITEPGTVMVIEEEGVLRHSRYAYDKRVAGVVSGAGDYRPGITLDNRAADKRRVPVALLGKVFCKVDAHDSPIAIGDLLTTSRTPGHAMKAQSQGEAFGAVIGKALRPLKVGKGLIPILIALQ